MMDKLQKCINRKRVNNSRSREVIYKILLNKEGCLNVNEIIEIVADEHLKKISINTVYRHLRFFIDCELVFVIQDDLKGAYYCLYRDEALVFSVCIRCSTIEKLEVDLCNEHKDSNFIKIYKVCQECKKT